MHSKALLHSTSLCLFLILSFAATTLKAEDTKSDNGGSGSGIDQQYGQSQGEYGGSGSENNNGGSGSGNNNGDPVTPGKKELIVSGDNNGGSLSGADQQYGQSEGGNGGPGKGNTNGGSGSGGGNGGPGKGNTNGGSGSGGGNGGPGKGNTNGGSGSGDTNGGSGSGGNGGVTVSRGGGNSKNQKNSDKQSDGKELGSRKDSKKQSGNNNKDPQSSRAEYSSYQNYDGYEGYDIYYDQYTDGVDPDRYGRDFDYGPVRNYQPSMAASMDFFITALPDWEGPGQVGYNGQYRGGNNYDGNTNNYPNTDNYPDRNNYPNTNYNQNANYQNDDSYSKGDNYKKNYRKKRSYSRVRFPVRQFKNYRDFPIERFPPLLSIFPWLPIFYDRISYQTFIFSPTGGIYIIPPLINFYGQRFAVAQLIKWGYASLVSSGAPLQAGVNVASIVQPPPPGGAPITTGVVGAGGTATAPAPTYNAQKASYDGGVKTDFPKFKPRYSQTIEEGGNRQYASVSKNNYGADTNYGGTGQQQVYPQGPQSKGPPPPRN